MTDNTPRDISKVLEAALREVRRKLIEKEKKNNGYIVVAGEDGKVRKMPAKDL